MDMVKGLLQKREVERKIKGKRIKKNSRMRTRTKL